MVTPTCDKAGADATRMQSLPHVGLKEPVHALSMFLDAHRVRSDKNRTYVGDKDRECAEACVNATCSQTAERWGLTGNDATPR